MAFNIADVLGNVPRASGGPEQITYIDLDRIDPDPKNFYSMSGLEDLAANIETIGLQQPLRVRPAAGGRYTVVSGHRRREACLMLRDGQGGERREEFARVPCIIESGDESEALRELRLIFANSATRAMTSAELARQVERVEDLLYTLKEEGHEFPGRMRDHVAQACHVSATKLARLKAIKNNLYPDLLSLYESGKLSEDAAYQMSRLPNQVQAGAFALLKTGKKSSPPAAAWVESVLRFKDAYTCERDCPASVTGKCTMKAQMMVRSLWEPYMDCWSCASPDGDDICCEYCTRLQQCKWACRTARENVHEKEKTENIRHDAERAARVEEELNRRKQKIQADAARILALAEAAGLSDDESLPAYAASQKIETLREYAAGNFSGKNYCNEDALIPCTVSRLTELADKLGTSLDAVVGRAEAKPAPVSGPDTVPQWQTGKPQQSGMYQTRIGSASEDSPYTGNWQRLEWLHDLGWVFPAVHTPLPNGVKVYRWIKLPEV